MSPFSQLKQLLADWIVPEPFPPELVIGCMYIIYHHLPYKRYGKKEYYKRLRVSAIYFIQKKGWKVDKPTVEELLKVLAEQCEAFWREVKCVSSSVIGSLLEAIAGSGDDEALEEALAAS